MTVIPLSPSIWASIASWYKDNPFVELFMNIDGGFVAVRDDEFLACGFLVKTSASFAMMEHLQVNPKANKISQGRALIRVAGFIIDEAQRLGFKCILGLTPDTKTSIKKMHKNCFNGEESTQAFKIIYKLLGGEKLNGY